MLDLPFLNSSTFKRLQSSPSGKLLNAHLEKLPMCLWITDMLFFYVMKTIHGVGPLFLQLTMTQVPDTVSLRVWALLAGFHPSSFWVQTERFLWRLPSWFLWILFLAQQRLLGKLGICFVSLSELKYMLSLVKVIFREVDSKADIKNTLGKKKWRCLPKYQTFVVNSPFLQWILDSVELETLSLLLLACSSNIQFINNVFSTFSSWFSQLLRSIHTSKNKLMK